MAQRKHPQHPDHLYIDALGGTTAVARLCRVVPESVSCWRIHGIPQSRRQYLELLRPDIFFNPPKKEAA